MNLTIIWGYCFKMFEGISDSQNHENILLQKVYMLGLDVEVLNCFTSYLTRTQVVRQVGKESTEMEFKCG